MNNEQLEKKLDKLLENESVFVLEAKVRIAPADEGEDIMTMKAMNSCYREIEAILDRYFTTTKVDCEISLTSINEEDSGL